MARILAVDDDQNNLMLIELYLKGQEFDVVRAADGREALERAEAESFDLILLDVLMPQMDGFEVCRRLKADPKTAFTPVIFLTARMSDESEKLQAYEMGAVDYIQKPVHREELVARIRVMLRLEAARNRLERENAALSKELRSAQANLLDCQRDLDDLGDMERNRESGGPGVLVLDRDGRIHSYNEQAARYLGRLPLGGELALASARGQAILEALDRSQGGTDVVWHPAGVLDGSSHASTKGASQRFVNGGPEQDGPREERVSDALSGGGRLEGSRPGGELESPDGQGLGSAVDSGGLQTDAEADRSAQDAEPEGVDGDAVGSFRGGAVALASNLRLVLRRDADLEDGMQCITLVDETASHSIRERLESRRPVVFPEDREDSDRYRVAGIIGRSTAMNELHHSVDRLRQTRSTVLIYGESGCGKELVARALHFDGRWRSKPFIPIHCGAMSPELIESELFGYEKGAFTGAQTRKDGLFSAADGGTIFLDEVAETSTALQVKLLRVLQTGEIRPVGSNRPQLVDVRIIAATNRNLEAMVVDGAFREDLFFRLDKVTLQLPPLRERVGDLGLLVQHFLQKYTVHYDGQAGPIHSVSEGAMACMQRYPWSGNVRELENVIDRAFAMGVTEVLQEADLPQHVREGRPRFASGPGRGVERTVVLPRPPQGAPGVGGFGGGAQRSAPLGQPLPGQGQQIDGGVLDKRQEELERAAIEQALIECGGRKVAAAHYLGWSKSKIYRRMKDLGMDA